MIDVFNWPEFRRGQRRGNSTAKGQDSYCIGDWEVGSTELEIQYMLSYESALNHN